MKSLIYQYSDNVDYIFMKNFSVFRNAVNSFLLILQDRLFKKLEEVI